ncbi:MAG: hypothetical protein HUK07_03585 [Bacteroidaceae bacterium]|nr:hypothetical protein [Bacteroidaceae bacterium]
MGKYVHEFSHILFPDIQEGEELLTTFNEKEPLQPITLNEQYTFTIDEIVAAVDFRIRMIISYEEEEELAAQIKEWYDIETRHIAAYGTRKGLTNLINYLKGAPYDLQALEHIEGLKAELEECINKNKY